MNKKLIVSGLLASFLLSGCGASNGLGLGKQEVKHYFQKGEITRIEKVTVDKSMMASVTGAGVGTVAGALIGAKESGENAIKGGLIGAGVGALGGFVTGYMINGNEVEAYEVDIVNAKTGKIHEAYLEEYLDIGTNVEFVDREDVVTNINVIKNNQKITKK